MKNKIFFSMTISLLFCLSCNRYVTTETSTKSNVNLNSSRTTSSTSSSIKKIGNKEIEKLEEEWKEEIITVDGSAPVIAKYNDPIRDKMLAKKAAILDAQKKLAEKISDTRISSTTTMRDLEATEVVRSKVNASLRDVEVVKESFNDKEKIWNVTLEMPKITLVRILESTIID